MQNYHNILPVILIDIIIILVFEGLLFFLYLVKQQENIINDQLTSLIKNSNTSQTKTNPNLITLLSTILQPYIQTSMNSEEQNNNKEYKLGLILFFSILLGIIITLIIYIYIVYKLGKTIDWITVIITVFITIFLIIILELLYVKYILFNKKFNDSQIKLDFINALL